MILLEENDVCIVLLGAIAWALGLPHSAEDPRKAAEFRQACERLAVEFDIDIDWAAA